MKQFAFVLALLIVITLLAAGQRKPSKPSLDERLAIIESRLDAIDANVHLLNVEQASTDKLISNLYRQVGSNYQVPLIQQKTYLDIQNMQQDVNDIKKQLDNH